MIDQITDRDCDEFTNELADDTARKPGRRAKIFVPNWNGPRFPLTIVEIRNTAAIRKYHANDEFLTGLLSRTDRKPLRFSAIGTYLIPSNRSRNRGVFLTATAQK
ncbi:MAG TPA: hypothetical protein VE860_00010 [Chthoniobacterales bacterium]|jgi:hypothetical protein|nr:hypothetical protein [Chthoniobacterales bacterium]